MGQFQMFCFTSSHTQRAPVSEPTSSCQLRARKAGSSVQSACIRSLRLWGLAGFIDVANGRLIDQQRRRAAAAYLDAVTVIPLDNALHLFAVFHYHHNRGFALDLLLVIIIFRVSLF